MAAVLLSILGVIGKALSLLPYILLVFLALGLFFPITYKVDLQKNQERTAINGSVSWLFRFIHAVVIFDKDSENKVFDKDIRIAGISVLKILEKRKKKKASSEASDKHARKKAETKAHRKPTVQPGQKMQIPEQTNMLPVEVVKAKHPGFFVRLGARISAFIGKIRKLVNKIRKGAAIASDWLHYFGSESFSRAKDTLLHEGTAILRHILPKKISGYMRFGTDDPAKTGMIFGLIAMLYPVLPEKLSVEPDFLESGFESDLSAKGHFFLIVLIVRGIRIILCRDVRILIGRILKTLKSGKKRNNKKSGHKGRGKSWQKTKKTMYFRTT